MCWPVSAAGKWKFSKNEWPNAGPILNGIVLISITVGRKVLRSNFRKKPKIYLVIDG